VGGFVEFQAFKESLAQVREFEKSNYLALACFFCAAFLTTAGLFLTLERSGIALFLLGQLALAIAFIQWFVIMHETGHHSLFRNAWMNNCAGHIAACLSLVPFSVWREIHNKHHVWTGWQDRDPTTLSLVPHERSKSSLRLVNTVWRLFFPLFGALYRFTIYWNPRRWPSGKKTKHYWNAVGVLCFWIIALRTLWQFQGMHLLLFFIGLWIHLFLFEAIVLSQHTHVPQKISHGEDVKPVPSWEQDQYTRSLELPWFVSRILLFSFNEHELHHLYPSLPCYHYSKIKLKMVNQRGALSWWKESRRMKGSDFMFKNRNQTGSSI
jgi:acyl-lipid omega-6 desaturase (Delta-12 desaturase)